jgi:hypothetical protein
MALQQLLHSIKDEEGRLIRPDYKAVGKLIGRKRNSVYVRYRDIVNKEMEDGVPGLQPVGTRATEEAARRTSNTADTSHFESSQPTPLTSPTTTAAPTATSSPIKVSGWKRKRSLGEEEEEDDDDDADDEDEDDDDYGDGFGGFGSSAVSSKRRKTITPRQTGRLAPTAAKMSARVAKPVFQQPSFLSFNDAADLLAVDERYSREAEGDVDGNSDEDAEGESDAEY